MTAINIYEHMKFYSKIVFFSLLIFFSTIIISCDSNNDFRQVLPYVPLTNIDVNLDYPDYFDLQLDGQAILIKEYRGEKVGYKGHGIIVIRTFEKEYRAWDATSTYDFNVTLLVKGAFATCPESSIKYELYNGTPHKQSSDNSETLKGTPALQEYYCKKISTNKLRISNKRY